MNTVGPAFPGTLLDWFAGQALNGILANPETALLFNDVHRLAYDHAESMLAEKARREADHFGDANEMVEDHFRGVTKMVELQAQNRELVERQNAQLRSLLRQAELAIAFANREPNVIRMLGDDYTEVLQLIRAALKEEKP